MPDVILVAGSQNKRKGKEEKKKGERKKEKSPTMCTTSKISSSQREGRKEGEIVS